MSLTLRTEEQHAVLLVKQRKMQEEKCAKKLFMKVKQKRREGQHKPNWDKKPGTSPTRQDKNRNQKISTQTQVPDQEETVWTKTIGP